MDVTESAAINDTVETTLSMPYLDTAFYLEAKIWINYVNLAVSLVGLVGNILTYATARYFPQDKASTVIIKCLAAADCSVLVGVRYAEYLGSYRHTILFHSLTTEDLFFTSNQPLKLNP